MGAVFIGFNGGYYYLGRIIIYVRYVQLANIVDTLESANRYHVL